MNMININDGKSREFFFATENGNVRPKLQGKFLPSARTKCPQWLRWHKGKSGSNGGKGVGRCLEVEINVDVKK